ncbi:MAG: serine hydrolase [Synechococcales cyanobacterium M58_A2018_015]|nr:serine hydrolase [Synechococcales cyanobacterium M58_A2018_015]
MLEFSHRSRRSQRRPPRRSSQARPRPNAQDPKGSSERIEHLRNHAPRPKPNTAQSQEQPQPEPSRQQSAQRPVAKTSDKAPDRKVEPLADRRSSRRSRAGRALIPKVAGASVLAKRRLGEGSASRGQQGTTGANQGERPAGQRTKVSPFVHLLRLLILGIGVGAIAGTVISIWDPSLRSPAEANQAADGASSTQPSNLVPSLNTDTIVTVQMGREMTEMATKFTPLTQSLTDLVPGVFVMDLDNGNFFSFNGATTFSAASMIKVPILVAFFQDVDAGKVRLDEMLTMQQTDLAEGSGDMQYDAVGTQYTALETATNMIITSDNTATNMIIRRLGGIEVLNRRFQQWGLQQTLLRKPLPDLEGTNTTSPKELVSLLALINNGKLLSMKSRDRTFDIMRRTLTDTLLPSVISSGSSVAHKTGDIGSLVGDTGIVDLPSGRRYAIAAMVKRPHNDPRAQELIRQMAAVVYEQFGGQPVIQPSPVFPATPGAPPAATPGIPQPGTVPYGVPSPGMPYAPGSGPQQSAPPAYPTAPPAGAIAPAPPVAPAPTEAAPPAAPDATPPDAEAAPETEANSGDNSDEG